MRLRELAGWTIVGADAERPLVILVIDEVRDDELAAALAAEDTVPSERFAGTWRAGARDGKALISFLLVEEAEPGLERAWWTDTFDRALLEAVARTPHDVALLPHALAGELDAARTGSADEVRARLAGAMVVEVEHPSARVAELLSAERGRPGPTTGRTPPPR